MSSTQQRVLIVFFTYTQQSRRVAETLAEGFRAKECDVDLAAIEFTDTRWAGRFSRFPLKHAYLDVLGIPPTNLKPDYEAATRSFAEGLATRLAPQAEPQTV